MFMWDNSDGELRRRFRGKSEERRPGTLLVAAGVGNGPRDGYRRRRCHRRYCSRCTSATGIDLNRSWIPVPVSLFFRSSILSRLDPALWVTSRYSALAHERPRSSLCSDLQVRALQNGVRGASVAQVVAAVYRADPRMKELIKEKLGCTAIDLMARRPRLFALSSDRTVVVPADSGAAFTMEEVAKHCTKVLPSFTGAPPFCAPRAGAAVD